jgi:hypothetical protein
MQLFSMRCCPVLSLSVAAIAMLVPFARGQDRVPCGAPNAGGRTNLYYEGDPCAFTYNVPSEAQQIRLLQENRQCTMYNRTVVNCSKPVTGNYGQVRLLPGSGGRRPGDGPPAYTVPSTAPPLGVPPQQQAMAEQLWQQAAALVNGERYRDAMPRLLQAANMGHARAQSMLGIIFQDGDGVKADDRLAAYWFTAAAAQGHRAAQYGLGGMYEEGEGGLPKDLAKATELYIKSANQGYDKAQAALGVAYELGQGVPRSREKAIALIRQSGQAQFILSVLTNPKTPARFADATAFGNYLQQVWNAQVAASAARARASWAGSGSPSGQVSAASAAIAAQRRDEMQRAANARNSIPAWIKQY